MTALARDLAASLSAALTDMPVVVLTGMRQTGKSTLLRTEQSLSHRGYLTLDDFAQLQAARLDPEAFLEATNRSPSTRRSVRRSSWLPSSARSFAIGGLAASCSPALPTCRCSEA